MKHLYLFFTGVIVAAHSTRDELKAELEGVGPQISVKTFPRNHQETPNSPRFRVPKLPISLPDLPDLPAFPSIPAIPQWLDTLFDTLQRQDVRESLSSLRKGDEGPLRSLLDDGIFDEVFVQADVTRPTSDSIIHQVQQLTSSTVISSAIEQISESGNILGAMMTFLADSEFGNAVWDLIETGDFVRFFSTIFSLLDTDGGPMCCEAISIDCRACSLGFTVEGYCTACADGMADVACLLCESDTILTTCYEEQRRAQLVSGLSSRQCSDFGDYLSRQCDSSWDSYMCYCVDYDGIELESTRHNANEEFDCEQERMNRAAPCRAELAKKQFGLGYDVPECTISGEYAALQCHGSTGFCWCVDRNNVPIDGYSIPPGSDFMFDCDQVRFDATISTPCLMERTYFTENRPWCEADGSFAGIQCDIMGGSYCWCVDINGYEIAGSLAPVPFDAMSCPLIEPPVEHDCFTIDDWSWEKSQYCCQYMGIRCMSSNDEPSHVTINVSGSSC